MAHGPDPSPRPSLFDRLVARAGTKRSASPRTFAGRAWLLPAAIALAAFPPAFWAAATVRTAAIRADLRRLGDRPDDARRVRAERAATDRMLAGAWRAPAVGTVLEAAGRALSDDASLSQVGWNEGALSIGVIAPDAERAAARLRRDPVFASLRATAQRPVATGTLVELAEPR